MNYHNQFFRVMYRAGAGLAVLLLAGCVGAPRWGSWSDHPTPQEVETVLRRTKDKEFYQTAGNTSPRPLKATVYFMGDKGEGTPETVGRIP